ncbi:MAG: rod shape-determining protein RodA [Rhodobacteraceae bacterium]|nr:MAG: rod shape-determining protein RodA [Paracoccaceae bacterium]
MFIFKNTNEDNISYIRKLLFFHWPLAILILATGAFGILMLYSVAGGSMLPWAEPQLIRFIVGFGAMIIIGFIHIDFWRSLTIPAYIGSILLLIAVMFYGEGAGAQRWIDLKVIRLQPSEIMKVTLIMALALYYSLIPISRKSSPLWLIPPLALIFLPTFLVFSQPDLGTSLLILLSGFAVMFLAGVNIWYFIVGAFAGVGLVSAVFLSRNTSWQFLTDYQMGRIDVYLNPSLDPLGAGYHITQSKIALGSGGLSGRGFMQGTQSQLDFLPEKHTDFIFTTLAEEFGYFGSLGLLIIYALMVIFCLLSAAKNQYKFGAILTSGLAVTFFLYFFINMAMVMGLAPVVGVPLPLISWGGSAMLVLLGAFGLIQSAHVHQPRG